jgi:Flp pilus assembly CpaF family ATPase
MLRTALGPAIAAWLEDPNIAEVMLNPDGRLWVDRLRGGLADSGTQLSAANGERIIRLVAHHVDAEVHAGAPRVSAELPDTSERFEGLIPPHWHDLGGALSGDESEPTALAPLAAIDDAAERAWAAEWLAAPACLVVEVAEIVVGEADEPDAKRRFNRVEITSASLPSHRNARGRA